MKIPFLLISLLIVLNVGAQKMERYEGKYPNNQHENATANYGYYKDAHGKKVKHGSFRYLVKIKSPERRLTRNIQGEYKNGWKNGEWNYTFSTKDYNIKNDGFFYTYSISLVAGYDNGYPHGEWNYTSYIKRRKSIRKDGKQKWSAYEIVQDKRIKMNYNQGVLVDSLNVYDGASQIVMAFMDKNGFLQGEFIEKTQNNKSALYFQEGFMFSSKNIEDNAQEIGNYKYFQRNILKLNESGIDVDTMSMFQDKSCSITKVLNDNVYNDSFFNFQYIDGDRVVSFVGSRKSIKVNYQGLFMRKLKVYISPEEQSVIQRIYAFRSSLKSQLNSCKTTYQASGGDSQKKKNYERLKHNMGVLNSCISQVETYKVTLAPQLILQSNNYANSSIEYSSSINRREILNRVYDNAKKSSIDSKSVKCR